MQMKKYIIVIFLLVVIILPKSVMATPGNASFKDDIFYKSIIDTLNEKNVNSINDRTIDYSVTDEELKMITSLTCGTINNTIADTSGLEKLTELQQLIINYPTIKELDIGENTKLETIVVLNANYLEDIDFSNNVNLKTIHLTYTHLKHLNVENCTKLTSIIMGGGYVSDAKIEQLDLSNCKELTKLQICGNKLEEINLENNINLTTLNLNSGNLEKIILPKNSKIFSLNLCQNKINSLENIENLDTSKFINSLYLNDNHIMDISILKHLTTIDSFKMNGNTSNIYLNKRKWNGCIT